MPNIVEQIDALILPVSTLQEKLYQLTQRYRTLKNNVGLLNENGLREMANVANDRISTKVELNQRHLFNRDLKTAMKVLSLFDQH